MKECEELAEALDNLLVHLDALDDTKEDVEQAARALAAYRAARRATEES